MAQDFSKAFYRSKVWQVFRQQLLLERGTTCEHCGKMIVESKFIQLHHKEELTPSNIHDTSITLNPENILVLCQSCHNKVHERYCKGAERKRKPRGIYIVYGPPMSGKTSYVLEHKADNDLVVDMDRLYQAVTLKPMYDKPDALRYNVLAVRNMILDNIKTRYGSFESAWIIGGYANKRDRERLASELGAELVYIESDKEECYYRLEYCNDYRQQHQEEWKKYIDEWFETYRA